MLNWPMIVCASIIGFLLVFIGYVFPLNADMVAMVSIPCYGVYKLYQWVVE